MLEKPISFYSGYNYQHYTFKDSIVVLYILHCICWGTAEVVKKHSLFLSSCSSLVKWIGSIDKYDCRVAVLSVYKSCEGHTDKDLESGSSLCTNMLQLLSKDAVCKWGMELLHVDDNDDDICSGTTAHDDDDDISSGAASSISLRFIDFLDTLHTTHTQMEITRHMVQGMIPKMNAIVK